MRPHPTSWRFILILFSFLRPGLPSVVFPSDLHTKKLQTPPLSTVRATPHAQVCKYVMNKYVWIAMFLCFCKLLECWVALGKQRVALSLECKKQIAASEDLYRHLTTMCPQNPPRTAVKQHIPRRMFSLAVTWEMFCNPYEGYAIFADTQHTTELRCSGIK